MGPQASLPGPFLHMPITIKPGDQFILRLTDEHGWTTDSRVVAIQCAADKLIVVVVNESIVTSPVRSVGAMPWE